MKTARIRPIAICLCRHGGSILVAELFDHVKGQVFYRPLGGTIEFGERGAQTVVREFREEIGAGLQDVRYLGTLENIFTCEGLPGHEIVLVYDARLTDPSLYAKERLAGDEMGMSFDAVWLRLDECTPAAPPLYPDGLLEMLAP